MSEDEPTLVFNSKQLDGPCEIGKRNRALISFLVDTGVRLAEFTGLNVADIDLKEGIANVRGKGNKERKVFFSPVVADSRCWSLTVRGDEAGSLFRLSPDGLRCS